MSGLETAADWAAASPGRTLTITSGEHAVAVGMTQDDGPARITAIRSVTRELLEATTTDVYALIVEGMIEDIASAGPAPANPPSIVELMLAAEDP